MFAYSDQHEAGAFDPSNDLGVSVALRFDVTGAIASTASGEYLGFKGQIFGGTDPQYGASAAGNSAYVDGSHWIQIPTLPNKPNAFTTEPFTLAAWINPAGNSNSGVIGGDVGACCMRLSSGGLQITRVSQADVATAGSFVSTNAWQMLGAVLYPGVGVLFFNNSNRSWQASATSPSSAGLESNSIGVRWNNAGAANPLTGRVAQVLIARRAWTDDDINLWQSDPWRMYRRQTRYYSIPGSSAKPWLYTPSTSVVYGYAAGAA